MYDVDVTLVDTVIKNLKTLDKNRVLDVLDELRYNPYTACGAILMSGGYAGYYRCKAGCYRIIYKIEERKVKVLVMKIGHRRTVYCD